MLALLAVLPAAAEAASATLAVEHERGEYRVILAAEIAAPRAQVWRVITDYPHLSRLSSVIRESRVVECDGDGIIVDTVTRACHGPFCRTLRHRQRLLETPPGSIVAETIGEASDFSSGTVRWHLADSGDGGTVLHYDMRIRPAFFVPPLIGPGMIRRALERETRELIDGIEREAAR